MRLITNTTITCALVSVASVCAAADRPNIVVLFSDDAGYADFGFQPGARNDIAKLTPHIDSLARDGVRCSQAYVSGCVCSPSRAGLMTGRYQERFGHDNNLPPGTQSGLPLAETFGAKRLQALGYRTGLVGKWHLGYPAAFHPNERGFDWFYGLLQGSRPYYAQPKISAHRVIQENGEPTKESGYVTDRFGDAACRFIEEHNGSKYKDQPFFLFVSFTAPHGPLQPRKVNDARLAPIKDAKRKKYAGLIVAMDDNVGKILAALEKAKVADDTLVIFTNDNGGQTSTGADNHPLRGKKGSLWEGGTRVPWAMRWPEKITAGTVIDDPVIALDLLPTFVAIAGGEIKKDWQLDGVNLLPRLTGEQNHLPTRPLFWRQHGSDGPIAMREGDWKLIHNRAEKGAQFELYNLAEDVAETKDLAASQPDLVKSLAAKMSTWESQLKKPLWGPGSK